MNTIGTARHSEELLTPIYRSIDVNFINMCIKPVCLPNHTNIYSPRQITFNILDDA